VKPVQSRRSEVLKEPADAVLLVVPVECWGRREVAQEVTDEPVSTHYDLRDQALPDAIVVREAGELP